MVAIDENEINKQLAAYAAIFAVSRPLPASGA